MILRKPYAILIKNFKLIHVIMAVFMGYLFYKTNTILSFFNEYLGSVATTINSNITNSIFNPFIVLSLVVIILGSAVILFLLMFKEKPIKFYIYNIFSCIFISIYYYISYLIIKSLELNLVDVKTLKLLADFALVSLFVQGVGIIIVIIRFTGFDFKSFNFKKDLNDLNIEAKDNEEFEVNVEFDKDLLKRKINRNFRHFKYTYFENKFIFNTIIVASCALLAFLIFVNHNVYNAIIPLNKTFQTNLYNFNFTEAYVTKYDYSGIELKKDYELVVIRFKTRTLGGTRKIGMGSFYLDVNGYKYYHTINYKDRVFDFGTVFTDQDIDNQFKEYVLVFEIPSSKEGNKMILKYTDTNHKVIDVAIRPISLNKNEKIDEIIYPEKLVFKNSILKDTSLEITNYDIAPNFRVDYDKCANDNCVSYYEYVRPTTENNATHLLKLDGNLVIDENINLTKVNNIYKLIKYFGKIKYLNGENYKIMNIDIKEVLPRKTKTNSVFIELSNEAALSEKLMIEFNIRGKIYNYVIK